MKAIKNQICSFMFSDVTEAQWHVPKRQAPAFEYPAAFAFNEPGACGIYDEAKSVVDQILTTDGSLIKNLQSVCWNFGLFRDSLIYEIGNFRISVGHLFGDDFDLRGHVGEKEITNRARHQFQNLYKIGATRPDDTVGAIIDFLASNEGRIVETYSMKRARGLVMFCGSDFRRLEVHQSSILNLIETILFRKLLWLESLYLARKFKGISLLRSRVKEVVFGKVNDNFDVQIKRRLSELKRKGTELPLFDIFHSEQIRIAKLLPHTEMLHLQDHIHRLASEHEGFQGAAPPLDFSKPRTADHLEHLNYMVASIFSEKNSQYVKSIRGKLPRSVQKRSRVA